jgi:hypothetical protein
MSRFKPCQDETRDPVSWLDKRQCFYITWTEHGRSRERSTGTTDREQAETIFAEWLHARGRGVGPSDPAEILVTDVLADYARERGPRVAAPRVIGCAIDALTGFWQGRTVADVTPQTCGLYVESVGGLRTPCAANLMS